LSFVSKHVVRVWAKILYLNIKKETAYLEREGIGPEQYGYSLILYTIDCSSNKFAPLANYAYKEDGTLLHTADFPAMPESIPPRSMAEVLSKAVCVESN
jgi:hypothetical protein